MNFALASHACLSCLLYARTQTVSCQPGRYLYSRLAVASQLRRLVAGKERRLTSPPTIIGLGRIVSWPKTNPLAPIGTGQVRGRSSGRLGTRNSYDRVNGLAKIELFFNQAYDIPPRHFCVPSDSVGVFATSTFLLVWGRNVFLQQMIRRHFHNTTTCTNKSRER